jgi:TrmH family RNA methyltransferase
MSLEAIRIVLVEPSHPGNIGASARAMRTMGLSQLYLVRPRLFPHAEATSMASGADDLLAGATVCGELDEALSGCRLVAGTSARLRTLRWPQVSPRAGARRLLEVAGHGPVALLFGREHSGLTNAELERCQYLVHIPTAAEYGSLNLAAAVQVLTYELRIASIQDSETEEITHGAAERLAMAEDLSRLYDHLERVLIGIDFLDPDNPRQLMRRLRRLFNRARLTENELNILRGILSAIDKSRRAGR